MRKKKLLPATETLIPSYELSYLGYTFGGGIAFSGFHFVMIIFPEGVDIESTYLKKKHLPPIDGSRPGDDKMILKMEQDPDIFMYALDGLLCASGVTRFCELIDDNFNTKQIYIYKSTKSQKQLLVLPMIGNGGSDKTTFTLIKKEDFEYVKKTYERLYANDPLKQSFIENVEKTMGELEKWEQENDYESIRKELPNVTDIVYVTKENAIEMTKSFIEDIIHMNDTKTKHSNLLNKLQESKQNITKSTNGGQNK